jgi:acyl-coenzyme A thioesterase PaaI-like protein
MATLPPSWMLSGISACFVSPGEGRAMQARSRVVHHGRLTAVVRTEITGKNRRRVLEAVTTHALRRHD